MDIEFTVIEFIDFIQKNQLKYIFINNENHRLFCQYQDKSDGKWLTNTYYTQQKDIPFDNIFNDQEYISVSNTTNVIKKLTPTVRREKILKLKSKWK